MSFWCKDSIGWKNGGGGEGEGEEEEKKKKQNISTVIQNNLNTS